MPIGLSKEQLLDAKIVGDHLRMLKDNFISTLNNQTCLDFTAAVVCHEEHTEETRKQILELFERHAKFKAEVITLSGLNAAIGRAYGDGKFVLTRLDDDDFVYNGAVADIHAFAETVTGISMYGFCRGFTYQKGTHDMHDFFCTYGGEGHNSIFQSICLDSSAVPFRPWPGRYTFNHVKAKQYLSQFKDVKTDFVQDVTTDAFVYFKHPDSSSRSMAVQSSTKKFRLTDEDRNSFKLKFGIDFDKVND